MQEQLLLRGHTPRSPSLYVPRVMLSPEGSGQTQPGGATKGRLRAAGGESAAVLKNYESALVHLTES